ncbi:hypothetical protein V6O07_23735, partial [Arthrospira platensis SPKY2]
ISAAGLSDHDIMMIQRKTRDQIEAAMTDEIKAHVSQHIKAEMKPLYMTLKNIKAEAQQIEKMRLMTWIKPLGIGAAILTGMLLMTMGTGKVLDVQIAKKWQTLQAIEQQIQQRQR